MQHAQDFNPLGARLDATTTKGGWLMMTDADDLEGGALLPGASELDAEAGNFFAAMRAPWSISSGTNLCTGELRG